MQYIYIYISMVLECYFCYVNPYLEGKLQRIFFFSGESELFSEFSKY